MDRPNQAEVKKLEATPEIKEELKAVVVPEKETAPEPQGKRWWAITYFVLLGGAGLLYAFTRLRLFELPDSYNFWARKLSLGLALTFLVLLCLKLAEIFWLCRLSNAVSRYNLKRVLRLVAGLAIVGIGITSFFADWYTAVVSLGLISLILGLALQTPISSFFAWIYILARKPFRVGDRIKIDNLAGDVIDVNYLDTTLWEFGGDYLSTDHPSGRLIKFPNSLVLESAVINYSWPVFPYIWNEIRLHIAYESDLEFVSKTMFRVAEEELGDGMAERVKVFREILAKTPVDHLQVREKPHVFFRVSENTWIEAIVRYLVEPRDSGRVKNNLVRKLLTELNKEPDKVLFPKSNMR